MTSAKPRRLPSGRVVWRVQFRVNGKVTSESFSVGTDEQNEREARNFAKLVDRVGGEAAQRVRNARDERTTDMPTLREWTETYLDPKSGHLTGVTDATRAGYGQIAERSFLQVLGEMPVDTITRLDVRRWIQWQEEQPSTRYPGRKVSAKTVTNYHGVLSSVLAGAADPDVRLVESNAAHKTKISKGRREGITFLTVEEVNRVIATMPEYYRPLALFLAWSGTRWGEATALTWADIDRYGEVPTVRIDKAWKKGVGGRPVLGPPKSEKANRTIAMLPTVIDALGAPGRPDELIFTGIRSGERIWSERFHKAAWGPALAALNRDPNPLGKKPRVHDLRHSHASWLIGDGAPLSYVQARLGHEKITTTVDTYGHLLPDANQQLSTLMARRMEKGLLSVMPASAPAGELTA